MIDFMKVDEILYAALDEDMPFGDITTEYTVPADRISEGRLIAKESGVIAGLPVFSRVFELVDPDVEITMLKADGDVVEKGELIATLKGPSRAILKGERVGLNLVQRMSGTASMTRRFVDLVKDYNVKIADTRKTTPGLRYLEKYAVRVGGGSNHRFSLSDGVLIKDNHIAAAGGITAAVTSVRANIPHTVKIEVETETLDMVKEAVAVKADIIMLDNMNNEMMTEAVKYIDGRALTEASGDMTEERIVSVAATGVDIISIGKLTHSVKSLDISLKF
ncbi:MAG: carboxylating nicotinate-nucleotide diphosphorylase [Ruminococcaceae bacterium]|nr:carboxylating nicotinate-nucleotide diphosphorylase [Oscillospiraceae bacterium]